LSALSLQNNKNLEVVLQREGTQYRGLVEDVDTNLPLSDVRIDAYNQRTNIGFTAVSDENGEYVLPLENSESYVIRFSKVGYSDINRNVSTSSTYNRSILGRTSIRRVGSTTPVTNDENTFEGNTGNANGQSIRLEDLPTESYSIQVAATDKPNLDRYADLNVYGNVYYMTLNNINKVRVGVFVDRAEADRVLKDIKSSGYKDAFVVKENTREVIDKIVLPEDTYIASPDDATRPTTTPTPNTVQNMSGYKVQLAAYQDTRYFDASKVDDLGYIEQMKKGNLTVMFVSGFSTLEEARRAMQRAQAVGFNSAFIVTEENGEIKRVNLP
jgi:hypothetical protein